MLDALATHLCGRATRAVCLTLVALTLQACGGGGGGDGVANALSGGSTSAPPPTGAAQGPLTSPSASGTNRAPVISGTATATITVGQAYDFTPSASDPDGNTLTFTAPKKPAWANFDPSSGRLYGQPGVNDAGAYAVEIVASDGSLQTALTFTLTVVQPTNRAPQLAGNGAGTLLVGARYSFTPTASDPDGQPLTFSVRGNPAWMVLDPARGALTGTASTAGTSTVTMTVSDGQLSASLTFTVVVGTTLSPTPTPVNRSPSIYNHGGATVTAGQVYLYQPQAGDPDGDPLTFSISGRPIWTTFDPATGRLTGTPGEGDAGVWPVTVSVSDGKATASVSFAIQVVAGNRAPTISGSGGATVAPGQPYSFTPVATDPDGNALTFSAAGRPAWMQLNAQTGALSGTPGAIDAGNYPITLTVSDGKAQASLVFVVTVSGSNRTPTISGDGSRTLAAGAAYSFTPTAADPDGDALTFTVAGAPAWLTLDARTGTLSGTAVAGVTGTSNVVLTVSDGKAQASLAFAISVTSSNRAPTLSGNGAASVTVGTAYQFTPTASDADGDTLTFSATGRPQWMQLNGQTGALSGTPAAADVGSSSITLTASDGKVQTSMTFTVAVVTQNRAPTIGGNGGATVMTGRAYLFTPTASDPDGNALTFSATGRPAWMALDTRTGTLTGTPQTGDIGSSVIVLTVSDGTLQAQISFTVTVVAAASGSATLSWTPPTTRTDGTTLSNLAGYRIYYGTSANALSSRIDVNNPGLTTYVVSNLTPGTWYFAASAVDANGLESYLSGTASKTVQ
jgi:hypothetical protein